MTSNSFERGQKQKRVVRGEKSLHLASAGLGIGQPHSPQQPASILPDPPVAIFPELHRHEPIRRTPTTISSPTHYSTPHHKNTQQREFDRYMQIYEGSEPNTDRIETKAGERPDLVLPSGVVVEAGASLQGRPPRNRRFRRGSTEILHVRRRCSAIFRSGSKSFFHFSILEREFWRWFRLVFYIASWNICVCVF